MSKGVRREREAVDLFKQAGYAVYRPATVRYGENDIFGFFDLMAIHPSEGRIHAVQIKSNSARGIQSWKRQTWLWRRAGWLTTYLVPYDNSGWKWIEVAHDGIYTIYDGRGSDDEMGQGLVEVLEP